MTTLGSIFHEMGLIRWPLLFSLLAVTGLTVWSAARLRGTEPAPDGRTKAWIDAVLFWGAFAAISGVVGTLIGVIVAAQSIQLAGEVSTALVWGGIKIALLSSAVGLLILGLSALSWFGLQLRWRLLMEGG